MSPHKPPPCQIPRTNPFSHAGQIKFGNRKIRVKPNRLLVGINGQFPSTLRRVGIASDEPDNALGLVESLPTCYIFVRRRNFFNVVIELLINILGFHFIDRRNFVLLRKIFASEKQIPFIWVLVYYVLQ